MEISAAIRNTRIPDFIKIPPVVPEAAVSPVKPGGADSGTPPATGALALTGGGSLALKFVSAHGDSLEVSKKGFDLSASKARGADSDTADETQKVGGVEKKQECQTCANRKYVDESDDASVSFQTPTKLDGARAAAAVAAHENEHVVNERAKAEREDRVVVNQTVIIKHAICPECGKPYVEGGVTRTTTADKQEEPETLRPDVLENGASLESDI